MSTLTPKSNKDHIVLVVLILVLLFLSCVCYLAYPNIDDPLDPFLPPPLFLPSEVVIVSVLVLVYTIYKIWNQLKWRQVARVINRAIFSGIIWGLAGFVMVFVVVVMVNLFLGPPPLNFFRRDFGPIF